MEDGTEGEGVRDDYFQNIKHNSTKQDTLSVAHITQSEISFL